MKAAFLVLTFLGWGVFALGARPYPPRDPFSDKAFKLIQEYYRVENGLPAYKVISSESVLKDQYVLQNVRLKVDGFSDVELAVKMPVNIHEPLPAVLLFTGFQTGTEAVNLVSNPVQAIYIGFQYPWPIRGSGRSLTWDWSRMESIPVLMAVALKWVFQQSYINREKVNVVNVSFGTLFFPLAQRFLNQEQIQPKSVVFGFGGTDIADVIVHELENKLGVNERAVLSAMIQSQVWFVEPRYHLHSLRGPFLIVNGSADTVFPTESRQGLVENLSEPKKVINLPSGHIQPDKDDLIQTFMNEVQQFFIENDAL